MSRKKVRKNGTYIIDGLPGDNPKLMGQETEDGRTSLYLEFYLGTRNAVSSKGTEYRKTVRKTMRLGLYLWRAPRTQEERSKNQAILGLARKLRFTHAQDMLENGEGYRLPTESVKDFNAWAWNYYDEYNNKDRRHIRQVCLMLYNFVTDPVNPTPRSEKMSVKDRNNYYKEREAIARSIRIDVSSVNKAFVKRFKEYLEKNCKGEGAHSTFARFKKMLKYAVEQNVLRRNPSDGITVRVDRGQLKKDILSTDEILRFASVEVPHGNKEIQRAFVFCCYTGLRWCDVKALKHSDIDRENMLLRFEQAKTRGKSTLSGVIVPLTPSLLKLVGIGNRNDYVFNLPGSATANQSLRTYARHAGITKHLSWHCARHSFAVNILNNGANIKTVSSLLGHSTLQHTDKYTRVVDNLKEAAILSLPDFDIQK